MFVRNSITFENNILDFSYHMHFQFDRDLFTPGEVQKATIQISRCLAP